MANVQGAAPKRECRPAGTERHPIICQLGGDKNENTTAVYRRQRLASLGLSKMRADLVASLAWGAVQ